MRIFYVLVILLLTGYANAFSQTVKISGQIKTKKDSALAGATVAIKALRIPLLPIIMERS